MRKVHFYSLDSCTRALSLTILIRVHGTRVRSLCSLEARRKFSTRVFLDHSDPVKQMFTSSWSSDNSSKEPSNNGKSISSNLHRLKIENLSAQSFSISDSYMSYHENKHARKRERMPKSSTFAAMTFPLPSTSLFNL